MKKRYYDEVEAEVNKAPGMGEHLQLHPFSSSHRFPRAQIPVFRVHALTTLPCVFYSPSLLSTNTWWAATPPP